MKESNALRDRLAAAIDAIPVIDVHTHLRSYKPHADNLAHVLLYHHLGTELASAGMPADAISKCGLPHECADPEIEPMTRVRNALPYLERIRNTTVGRLLRTLLADLYDVPNGEVDETNVDDVAERVAKRADDETWPAALLRERCRIEHSVTVEHVREENARPGFSFMSEAFNPFCLQHKSLDLQAAFRGVERCAGMTIADAATLRAAVQKTVQRQLDIRVLAMMVWLPPDFIWRDDGKTAVREAIDRLRKAAASPADRDVFLTHALRAMLDLVRDSGLRRMQVFLGAEVKLPHRSISIGSGLFGRELCKMFGAYEDIRFDLTTAALVHSQDICIIAKHFPNVGVAGYWWHTLYPRFIRDAIECRFDIVPSNKIIAFFSDAYHAEWCYPKLKLVKRLLTDALEQKVLSGDYSEDYAIELARRVLFDNPREAYGIA